MSNNPPVVLELTKEEAEFLLQNCDKNIEFGLHFMVNAQAEGGPMTPERRATVEKIIGVMEQFKALKAKTAKAMELPK